MEKIDLFSTSFWRKRIDPIEWDKNDFVSDVTENYRRDPFRNTWGSDGTLHHCYNDWDNPKFINYKLDKLMPIYGNLVQEFVKQLPLKKLPRYRYVIINVTANKSGQYMGMHDHLYSGDDHGCAYSCVHYVSLKGTQPSTTFCNPYIASYFGNTMNFMSEFLDMHDANNSEYADTWSIPTKEDDFVIFPSYLKHKVQGNWQSKDPNELRITVVVNIDFFRD